VVAIVMGQAQGATEVLASLDRRQRFLLIRVVGDFGGGQGGQALLLHIGGTVTQLAFEQPIDLADRAVGLHGNADHLRFQRQRDLLQSRQAALKLVNRFLEGGIEHSAASIE
jgi:hypothetical protein